MRKKLATVRLHAEEKGHWIVAFGYFGSVLFSGGHNSVLTGTCYALAAALATHHANNVRTVRKGADDN